MGQGNEVGDGEDLTGNHHGSHQHQKQQILSLEFQLGKGIGRQGHRHQLAGGDHCRHQDAVFQVGEEGNGFEGLCIVLPLDGGGDPLGGHFQHLVAGLDGGEDHPDKGQQDKGRTQNQDQIGKTLGQLLTEGGFHRLVLLSSKMAASRTTPNWSRVTASTMANSTKDAAAAEAKAQL